MAQRFFSVGVLLLLLAGIFPVNSLGVPAPLDYPHSPEFQGAVAINCLSCHFPFGKQAGYLPPWQDVGKLDDSASNDLCWSCHNNVIAIEFPTHSSNTIDDFYGDWSVQCQTCHWVHKQRQFRKHESDSYLAVGTSTSVGTSTLTMTGANWALNEFAGLILVPNLLEGYDYYNYRILNNTDETITINGSINGAVGGEEFAVIYGKLIDTTIDLSEIDIIPPKSGLKEVKFLGDGVSNTFADADADGDGRYTGVCEVCHTRTAYHRNNNDPAGPGDIWENDPNGRPNHTHNVSVLCTKCHKHSNGFMGMGGGAHEVHVLKDYGPEIYCSRGDFGCHGNEEIPAFADGLNFTDTTKCEDCHSADGVAAIKANGPVNGYWNHEGSSESEPDSWAVIAGERSFCGSCHDATPGNTEMNGGGNLAPNVLGDDANYGFYFTGHGLQSGNYPRLAYQGSTGTGNPSAARTCSDCHDAEAQHFGGLGARLKPGFENDQDNSNCNNCHALGEMATNPPDLYKYPDLADPLPSDYEGGKHGVLLCSHCHDVHGRYVNALNEARPTGLGMIVNEDGVRALCLNCHNANHTTAPPGSPECFVCHGDGGIANAPLLPPLSPAAHLDPGAACSGCHNPHNPPHGEGSTGVGCVECHGHEAGTAYDPDMAYPYEPGVLTSPGRGTVQSHSTHTEIDADDIKGPAIYCDSCHDINDFPAFRLDAGGDDANGDGRFTLSETAVCDPCHSPAGDYDGVDDSVLGAKANWETGVYETPSTLQEGKEKWCATCHDSAPSVISGVSAPNVIGNESVSGRYGTGYGYYKSGHGLPSEETYVYSGGLTAGAGQKCDGCHDFSTAHIDGDARTFNDGESSTLSPSFYRMGYRLKLVDGMEPMRIPLPVNTTPWNDYSHFLLCFNCHDSGPFLDSTNMNTNMITLGGDPAVPVNRHEYHLNFNNLHYPADWSGANTSTITCVVCHNVHGSDQLAMIRDGKLTSREPGLLMWYYNPALVTYQPNINPPDPENLPLSASTGKLWRRATSGNLCDHCHGGDNPVPTVRTPYQPIDQTPALAWTGENGYLSDGANPDAGPGGLEFEFRVKYSDSNNDAPLPIELWIDEDDDGSYAAGEKYPMDEADIADFNYIDGKLYTLSLSVNKAGDNIIRYRFYASDGAEDAIGPPTFDGAITLLNDNPALAWTGEPSFTSDGVNPDFGANGGSYEFRVSYADLSDECPPTASDIQVWIDVDDSGTYEPGEKFNMAEVDVGDPICSDGKLYAYSAVLAYVGDGFLNYRFYAFDGKNSATGDPILDNTVRVSSFANAPPMLAQTSGNCLASGVRPPVGDHLSSFEFMIEYTDLDDPCPTGAGDIQVWIDEDDSGTYEGTEQYNLAEVDGGDADCTDGKLYSVILPLAAAGNGDLNYRFFANDGTQDAWGLPISDGVVTVIDAITVKPEGTGDYTSVQAAINASSDPSTILVYPNADFSKATYSENINVSAKSNRTLQSACGADLTVISAAINTSNTIYWQGSSNIMIDGFSLTGATESTGFSVNGAGSKTIKNSKVHGNSGGVVINNGTVLAIEGCEIYSNTGNGVYTNLASSAANVTDSEIYSNGNRGFNFNSGTHSIADSIIRNNSAPSGGGIYANGATVTVTRTLFKENNAADGGGAYMNSSTMNCYQSEFIENTTTASGAGIRNVGANTLTVENTIFSGNIAATNGGAIYGHSGSLSLVNNTFAGNQANNGGAVGICGASITVRNSIFWSNVGTNSGSNIYKECGAANFGTITDTNIFSVAGYVDGGTFTTDGTNIDPAVDPMFVGAGDYHLQAISPVIDQANATYAPALDIDGDSRPLDLADDMGADERLAEPPNSLPTLAWTAESGYENGGVAPNPGMSGVSYAFRVDYIDADENEPFMIQLWLDVDENGAFGESEKFDLAEVDAGDLTYADGKRYSVDLTLTYPGGGELYYRFYANDGFGDATGTPTGLNRVEMINNVPTLAWTNELNYDSDGVDPDSGPAGSSFTFRIDLTDADNSLPSLIEVWVDTDDSGAYSASEAYALIETDSGDVDTSDGKRYTVDVVLPYSGDGDLNYRFYATDGVDAATGAPTSSKIVTVTPATTNGPALSWAPGDCMPDGVRPPAGASGTDFEFQVRFTDVDNQCPAGVNDIQVWIDINDGGSYSESEKYGLTEVDPFDVDCTDGKLYSTTLVLSHAGDGAFNYRFWATDGVELATGESTADSVVEVLGAFKVRPTGGNGWYSSIQSAFDASVDPSTILVYPNADFSEATYVERVSTSLDKSNRTIRSVCGSDLTIVSAPNVDTGVMYFQSSNNLVIDGFSVTGASNVEGVTFNNATIGTIKNSKIYGNSIGVNVNNGSIILVEGNEIYNNTANGVYTNGGTTVVTVANSEIYANDRGVFFNFGSHFVNDSLIRDNASTGSGGGIYLNSSTATVTNTFIRDNVAPTGGGVGLNSGILYSYQNTFTGNHSTGFGGGAMYANGSSALFENSILVGNFADTGGGGSLKINAGAISIINSTLADNQAAGNGGAIDVCNGSTTVRNSIFWGNSATGSGFNIYKSCGASNFGTITDSDITSGSDGIAGGTFTTDGSNIDPALDPLFVGGGDYHLQSGSPVMDQANAAYAPDIDFDGDARPLGSADDMGADEAPPNIEPTLDWTGEANYLADGVDPETAANGADFTFRIDYADAEDVAPTSIQVWIDEDDSGTYESGEKHDMTEADAGDLVYADGKRYSVVLSVNYGGDGVLNYRFYASDGLDDALGDPTLDNFLTVTNTAPTLAWTGEVGFETDGINPDNALGGSSFEFRIDYSDADNNAPLTIQIWLDEDDSGTYEAGEKYDMNQVDGGDVVYTDGKLYTAMAAIAYAGDGSLNYRFYASDGSVATGAPTLDKQATIVNNPPVLAWTAEVGYETDGVNPDSDADGSDFEFRVSYSDVDNQAPTAVDLWVDEDDSGTYEDPAEKHAMAEVDGGDVDYTDGKLYALTLALAYAGDGAINYAFSASDGTDPAGGNPTLDNQVTITQGGPTITVCASPAGDFTTIQAAINDAGTIDGTTVVVCNGIYSENIDFGAKNITVKTANGKGAATIQGSGANAAVATFNNAALTSNAVLDGFILDNIAANSATRGVYVAGGATPTIKSCIIQGNYANNSTDGGAGMYVVGASPFLDDVTIRANFAGNRHGCGMFIKDGASGATIANSTIGGPLDADGNKCTNGIGGGIYFTNSSGVLDISDSNIQFNQGNSDGGGLYLKNNTGATIITNTTILDNYTQITNVGYGGGIHAYNSPLSITGGSVSNNTGGINRGAGGIYFYSSGGHAIDIAGVTIGSNIAGSYGGGGIYLTGDTVTPLPGPVFTMSKSYVIGNQTQSNGNGGGIYMNIGSADITNSIISGNTTGNNYWSSGGGIYNNGATMNIEQSTIAGNWANRRGGGIYVGSGATTIDGSLFWDNNASDANTADVRTEAGITTVTYSAIESGSNYTDGGNNVFAITGTVFVASDPATSYGNPKIGGDYHIKVDAAEIIDAADPASTVVEDIDNQSRAAGINDMGADELP